MREKKWPIGYSMILVLTVSAFLWWQIVKAGHFILEMIRWNANQ